jgi:hypothetical protein
MLDIFINNYSHPSLNITCNTCAIHTARTRVRVRLVIISQTCSFIGYSQLAFLRFSSPRCGEVSKSFLQMMSKRAA